MEQDKQAEINTDKEKADCGRKSKWQTRHSLQDLTADLAHAS
jgi:hypothetical protein